MDHAFWGPAFDDEAIMRVLSIMSGNSLQGCVVSRITNEDELWPRRRADCGSEGRGWLGRMEWGRGRWRTALSFAIPGGIEKILIRRSSARMFRPFCRLSYASGLTGPSR